MQAIGRAAGSTASGLGLARREPPMAYPDESIPAPTFDLVPMRPVPAGALGRGARSYPLASFLAHLIAVRERAPQTRRRGRAAPGEASAAYAAMRTSPPRPTTLVRKSA